jgi:hypothetical protein
MVKRGVFGFGFGFVADFKWGFPQLFKVTPRAVPDKKCSILGFLEFLGWKCFRRDFFDSPFLDEIWWD